MISCLRPIHPKSVGTFSANLLVAPNRTQQKSMGTNQAQPPHFSVRMGAEVHFADANSLLFLRTRLMCRSKSPLRMSSARMYCVKTGTVHE